MSKTTYINEVSLSTNPREVVMEFVHKLPEGAGDDSDPIRIAMTHQTFDELRGLFADFGKEPAEKPKKETRGQIN